MPCICCSSRSAFATTFGSTSVLRNVDLSEVTPWTKQEVYNMVAEAVEPERTQTSHEARHSLHVIFDSHLSHILSPVAKFLDEDPDVTGGTMGEPRTPPEWMRLLRVALTNTFWAHIPLVYMGPLNGKETTLRLLQNYFWLWVQFHD